MNKIVLGVLLAGLAQFMLGFLYWGASSLPYGAFEEVPDEAAAQADLARHFPRSGSYLLPAAEKDPETFQAMLDAGPSGVFHVALPPRPMMDPATLGLGLVHNIVVAALIAVLLLRTGVSGYGNRVVTVTMAGLAASVFFDLGDVLWWQHGIAWALTAGLYNVLAWVVVGLVLAKFLPDGGRATGG